MVAGQIYALVQNRHNTTGVRPDLLVAPSSSWTLGHPEEMRRVISGANGSNHDERECQAMLYYYGTNPEKWTTFEKYYSGLSKKKK
jgi:hypothetical protein